MNVFEILPRLSLPFKNSGGLPCRDMMSALCPKNRFSLVVEQQVLPSAVCFSTKLGVAEDKGYFNVRLLDSVSVGS